MRSRMMRKDLGFTCIAILFLDSLSARQRPRSAPQTPFSIQPLPFAEGNRLVQLKQTQPGVGIDNLGFLSRKSRTTASEITASPQ